MRDAFLKTTDAIFHTSLSGQVRARRSEGKALAGWPTGQGYLPRGRRGKWLAIVLALWTVAPRVLYSPRFFS